MWVCAEILAIAAQAACGSPKAIAFRSWPPETTSMVKAYLSVSTSALAASISWRTGVMPRVPMMRLAVISAPTQWEMSMTSCTEQPGKKYRSEEHTSELQSRGHLVCRLLLEKKKSTGEAE